MENIKISFLGKLELLNKYRSAVSPNFNKLIRSTIVINHQMSLQN